MSIASAFVYSQCCFFDFRKYKPKSRKHVTFKFELTTAEPPARVSQQPSFWSRPLSYQLRTLWLFIRSDVREIVVLGALFGILGALAAPAFGFARTSFAAILLRLPAMLLWSGTHLLHFTLSNQRAADSILEDKINKPWRPLPAQRLTVGEATRLTYALYPVAILVSACLGGMGPGLAELVFTVAYNEGRGAEEPILRNLLAALGIACFLAGPLEIALGGQSIATHPIALAWLALLAAAIFTTIHVSDFRDAEGDKQRARRTVPLVVGDAPARWMVALCVVGWSWQAASFWGMGAVAALPSLAIGAVLIAKLLVGEHSLRKDKAAYKVWPVWMLSFFLMPLVKMHLAA